MDMLTVESLRHPEYATTKEVPGTAKSFEEQLLGSGYAEGDFTTVTLTSEDYQPRYRVRYGAQDEQYFFVRKKRYMELRDKVASLFVNCVVYEAIKPFIEGLHEKTRIQFGAMLSDNYVIVPYCLGTFEGCTIVKSRGMKERRWGRGRMNNPFSALVVIDMALNGVALNKGNSIFIRNWSTSLTQRGIRTHLASCYGDIPGILKEFEEDVIAYTAQQQLQASVTGADYKG